MLGKTRGREALRRVGRPDQRGLQPQVAQSGNAPVTPPARRRRTFFRWRFEIVPQDQRAGVLTEHRREYRQAVRRALAHRQHGHHLHDRHTCRDGPREPDVEDRHQRRPIPAGDTWLTRARRRSGKAGPESRCGIPRGGEHDHVGHDRRVPLQRPGRHPGTRSTTGRRR